MSTDPKPTLEINPSYALNKNLLERLVTILAELREATGLTDQRKFDRPIRFSDTRLVAIERLTEAILWLELDTKIIKDKWEADHPELRQRFDVRMLFEMAAACFSESIGPDYDVAIQELAKQNPEIAADFDYMPIVKEALAGQPGPSADQP